MAIIIVSPPAWDTGATCDGCGNSLKDRGSPEDKVYAAKLRQLDARAAGDQCTLWPYALHDGGLKCRSSVLRLSGQARVGMSIDLRL